MIDSAKALLAPRAPTPAHNTRKRSTIRASSSRRGGQQHHQHHQQTQSKKLLTNFFSIGAFATLAKALQETSFGKTLAVVGSTPAVLLLLLFAKPLATTLPQSFLLLVPQSYQVPHCSKKHFNTNISIQYYNCAALMDSSVERG
jgi:hypothetical protein